MPGPALFLKSPPDAPGGRGPSFCSKVNSPLAFLGASIPPGDLQTPAGTILGQQGPDTGPQSPDRLMAKLHQESKRPGPPGLSSPGLLVLSPSQLGGKGVGGVI